MGDFGRESIELGLEDIDHKIILQVGDEKEHVRAKGPPGVLKREKEGLVVEKRCCG